MVKVFLILSKFFLFLLIFLLPIFVLPFTNDFFAFPKANLFLFATLLIFLFWILAQVFSKKFSIKTHPFVYPLLLIFLGYLISFLVNWASEEKFAGIWVSLPFLFFPLFSLLIINLIESKKDVSLVKNFLVADGVIISGLAVFLFLLPASRYPISLKVLGFPFLIINSSFSPTGNSHTSFLFLLVLLPIIFKNFSELFLEKDKSKLFYLKVIFQFIIALIITTGLGILGFQVFFLNKPVLLPSSFGWSIGVDTLKNPLNALFGLGPGEFSSAFTQFKPVSYNLTNLWSTRFLNSSNEIFQILTTLGLTGIAAFLFLISKIFKTRGKAPEFYSLLIIIVFFIFLPADFLTYFLLILFINLLVLESRKYEEKNFDISRELTSVIGIITAILTSICFYLLGRNFASEYYFQRSLIAASENKGLDTYNLQIKALLLNPYRSYFHQVYSQTNLALANSLASRKDLSDQDKQIITQLVQQAIREARNAAFLAPKNVGVWGNLASVYRQLINFAQGADQWASTSYIQAIRLDPNNPLLYLDLGGLNYSLGKYDEAIGFFQTSVNLKPDFANGWYNLAAAYKEKKEWQKALDSLNQTSRFILVNSPDWQKVQKEIEEVKEKLPKPQAEKSPKGEETLKLPEPIPSPKPQITPIELPPEETINPEKETNPAEQ